jgi:stage III sporulation protein AB
MESIKLIGAVLVVLAGAGFGTCPVHKMKERTKEFEALYFCLLRLKSEISHGGRPLPEALKAAADSKKEGVEGIYRGVMRNLAARLEKGREAYEVQLRECVADAFSDTVITKEEQEAFLDTFLLLGGADKEKQVQMLSYYAENVRLSIAQEKQKKKEKSYLYRSLGVLGGIFLAVIMY